MDVLIAQRLLGIPAVSVINRMFTHSPKEKRTPLFKKIDGKIWKEGQYQNISREKKRDCCIPAVRKFSSWLYQFRYYIFSIYSNSYVHHTEVSHVGTSHVLKLWMLARSTAEFQSCRNRCTSQLPHTKAQLRFHQHSSTICTAPPAQEERPLRPQSPRKLPTLERPHSNGKEISRGLCTRTGGALQPFLTILQNRTTRSLLWSYQGPSLDLNTACNWNEIVSQSGKIWVLLLSAGDANT